MPLQIPEALLTRATDLAVRNSADRLRVDPAEISGDTRVVLQSSVRKALEEQFTGAFDAAARHSVAEVVNTPELGARLADKLSLGAQMATLVSADGQYLDILAKNAQMQKAKFDAYVTAGFTEDQAFRLLEAEVLGKAGAKAGR
jgi:hypothetical protein